MTDTATTGPAVTERTRRPLRVRWVPGTAADGHVRLQMVWSPSPVPAPVRGGGVTLAA
jgi:hypothetical protein